MLVDLLRDFTGIVGWFYFSTDDIPADNNVNSGLQTLDKPRVFTVTVDALNVRSEPSTDAEIVATYEAEAGEEFNYTEYCYANGYEWLSHISHSGARRYVASMELESGASYGDRRYLD